MANFKIDCIWSDNTVTLWLKAFYFKFFRVSARTPKIIILVPGFTVIFRNNIITFWIVSCISTGTCSNIGIELPVF